MDCQRKSMPWIDGCVNYGRSVGEWTLRRLLALVVPDCCRVCGASGIEGGFCGGCANALPRHPCPCRVCGAALAAGDLCGRCQLDPPPITGTVAPFRYDPPVSESIHQLKYHRSLAHGRDLGLLLAGELERGALERPEALVPVPLHWRRQFRRGFNQSLEIARPISGHLGIPVRMDIVARRSHTTPQVGLRPARRRRNTRGAFRVRGQGVPGCVAIVDDVVTSGATVFELARCLRRAGARDIYVWAAARA